jgi:hypothetical protein
VRPMGCRNHNGRVARDSGPQPRGYPDQGSVVCGGIHPRLALINSRDWVFLTRLLGHSHHSIFRPKRAALAWREGGLAVEVPQPRAN